MQKKLEIAPHSKILKVWWCSGAGNSHKPLHRQNSPPYRIISSTLSFYFLKGTAKVDAMYKKGFNFSSVDPTCTLIKADAVICPLKSSSMKKTEANNQRDAGYIFMKLTHDSKKHKKPTKKSGSTHHKLSNCGISDGPVQLVNAVKCLPFGGLTLYNLKTDISSWDNVINIIKATFSNVFYLKIAALKSF